MKIVCSALLALYLLFPVAITAQQEKANEVKDNASKKAEDRLDTRIDQGLDKGLNAIEGLFSKKKNKKASEKAKQANTSSSIPASSPTQSNTSSPSQVRETPAADLFLSDFVGSYRITINTEKNGKDKGTVSFDYYFNQQAWAMVTEDKGNLTRIIMDFDTDLMTTLMEQGGDKTGIKMKMPRSIQGVADEPAIEDVTSDFSFTKTGKTKTIEGKLCHQYIGTSSDGKFDAWVDESSEIDMSRQFSAFAKKGKKENWQSGMYKGLTMESTWTSANGKEVVHMTTSNVQVGSVDAAIFTTGGYEIIDMTSLPGLGGQ